MPQIIERMAAAQTSAVAPTKTSALQTTPNEGTQKPDASGVANPEGQAKSPDAQRLESLARREKALRREAQRLAQEKAANSAQGQTQQQLDALRQENARMKGWVQRFYRDPVQVLNEAGVHGDVITNGLMNQPSREAVSIRALQAQNAQLAEQIKALEGKMTDGQQAQYDQAKSQIRSDAKMLVSQDATNYEALAAEGQDGLDAVVELIEQTFEKEDRLMTVKEAADEVENFLLEEAMKLSGLNKVKQKLGQASTTGGQPQSGQPASSQGPTTLSNRGLPAPAPKGRRTEKERIAAAIAAFQQARV